MVNILVTCMVQNILTIQDNIVIAPEEVVDLLVDTQPTVLAQIDLGPHEDLVVVSHEVVVHQDITIRTNIVVV